MTKYFYMLLRKKKVPKKIAIRNTKPKFIRVHSGEFNFYFSDVSNFDVNNFDKHLNKWRLFAGQVYTLNGPLGYGIVFLTPPSLMENW